MPSSPGWLLLCPSSKRRCFLASPLKIAVILTFPFSFSKDRLLVSVGGVVVERGTSLGLSSNSRLDGAPKNFLPSGPRGRFYLNCPPARPHSPSPEEPVFCMRSFRASLELAGSVEPNSFPLTSLSPRYEGGGHNIPGGQQGGGIHASTLHCYN